MHSISIDGEDLLEAFCLVPVTRPVVNEPASVRLYVDTHGIDGPLDLSEALTGFMTYQNRTGSWEFYVKNHTIRWDALLHKIANRLHGRKVAVVLEDDPGYYYVGRLEVDKLSSAPKISISYNFEPYKYEITGSTDDWLWDPFSFEAGVIREYGELTVDGALTLTVAGSARPVVPTITASAAMTVTFDGVTYNLAAGANRIPQIRIGEDEQVITFTGTGTVSVDFRGGWL